MQSAPPIRQDRLWAVKDFFSWPQSVLSLAICGPWSRSILVSPINALRIQEGKTLVIHCGITLGVWET